MVNAEDADADDLGNYANFLTDVRGDHDGAERLYKRALELQPDHANNLGNYAEFLFVRGRGDEAVEYLGKAFAAVQGKPSVVPLHFYACALSRHRYPSSLSELKALLKEGARQSGNDLDAVVRFIRESGDEHADFIAALADVVSDKAEIATLEKFAPWQKGHS